MSDNLKANYREIRKSLLKKRTSMGLCYCGKEREDKALKGCKQCREKIRARYHTRRTKSICSRCSNKVDSGQIICNDCAAKSKERRSKIIASGKCENCGKKNNRPGSYCQDCKTKKREVIKQKREVAARKSICSRCFSSPVRKKGVRSCQDCYDKISGNTKKIFKGDRCSCGEAKERNSYACTDCRRISATRQRVVKKEQQAVAFKKGYCMLCCKNPQREDGTTCKDCYKKRAEYRERVFISKKCSCGRGKRANTYACSACRQKENRKEKQRKIMAEERQEQLIAEEMLVDEFYNR